MAICVVVDVMHVNTCRPLETGGENNVLSGVVLSITYHPVDAGECGWMWKHDVKPIRVIMNHNTYLTAETKP